MMMKPALILWTCKDMDEARQIVKTLLEERLIACASILPSVESHFRWDGKIDLAKECKIFLKTDARHFAAVQSKILDLCSYDVPEILLVSIEDGNPDYLAWIQKEVG